MHENNFSLRRHMFPIWLALLLAEAGFMVIMPLLPLYIQELGLTDPTQIKLWAGAMNSGQMIGMAVMALFWGQLADRYGRKVMAARASFAIGLAALLVGFASQPWQVLALRVGQGFFAGTVAAFTVLVTATVPRDRVGASLGFLQTGAFVGYALGPVLGGAIADRWGFRASAFTGAGLAGIAGFIILLVVHERFTPIVAPGRLSLRSLAADVRLVATDRYLLMLALSMFMLRLVTSLPEAQLPLYVQELQPLSLRLATLAGAVTSAGAITSAAASLAAGRLGDRHGYGRLLVLCALGAALLYAPQPFVTGAWQLLLLQAGVGIFVGGLLPTMNALIGTSTAGGHEGASFGLAYMVSNMGVLLGPILGAGLASVFSIRATFGAAGLLFALIAVWVATRFTRTALARSTSR